MTVPLHPEKHGEQAVHTAEQSVEYFDPHGTVPRSVVLVFDDDLLEHVRSTRETTTFGAFGEGHRLEAVDGVGVLRVPGVGGPATAAAMEGLIARGAERFVLVGIAGSLQPDLGAGDFAVADEALRDEGTSHHYMEDGRSIAGDPALRDHLETGLAAADLPARVGPTWTTDAIYRETGAEVRRHRDADVLTVEMEAASAFAVAEYRGVAAGAAFTVSDRLEPDGWEPAFDESDEYLARALDAVVDALG